MKTINIIVRVILGIVALMMIIGMIGQVMFNTPIVNILSIGNILMMLSIVVIAMFINYVVYKNYMWKSLITVFVIMWILDMIGNTFSFASIIIGSILTLIAYIGMLSRRKMIEN